MGQVMDSRDEPIALPSTERRNPASTGLDVMSSIEILRLMNAADREAVDAVAAELQPLSELVDAALNCVRRGGRVHYFGAGTSGRLGVLDAAELAPTFSRSDVVFAHIAGGERAIQHAVENSEDSAAAGEAEGAALGPLDVAIGLAASGGTPYVRGALTAARRRGALTALVTSNPDAPLASLADYLIAPDTGPEVLTGSTRLKAGTAEKVVLNGFSTALMVGLGLTYSNLMVSVSATNAKLRDRAVRMLAEVAEVDGERAASLLEAAGGDLKLAIVCAVAPGSLEDARDALAASDGSIRAALSSLTGGREP
jgi:N-acetylmuramic acid 6-phosphate etherase